MDSFFAQHVLFAGFASFLMVAVLPGLALYRAGLYPAGWLSLPVIFGVSLTLHFQLVFYLTLVGAYRIEILVLVFLMLAVWLALPRSRAAATPALSAQIYPPQSALLRWSGVVLALVATVQLLVHVAGNIPGVFSSWDAIVSWNRWAQDWYSGTLPRNTFGYPQLVPSAWAGTYIWLGSARIETWAQGLMGLFPLATLGIFADMYVRLRSSAALFAIAIWTLVLMAAFPDLIDSGYVDVPVSFFILLTAYILLLLHRKCLSAQHGLLLAAIAAAGAVLTKQSGLLAVIMLMWAIQSFLRQSDTAHRKAAKTAIIVFLGLVGPWFAYKYFQIFTNVDPSNVAYVTSGIYSGEPLFNRLLRTLTVNTPALLDTFSPEPWKTPILLILMISAFASLQKPLGRVCWFAVVLPYYVMWALFFSYDMRNLMPAIPFAALGVGFGLEAIGEKLVLLFPRKTLVARETASTKRRFELARGAVIPAVLLLLVVTFFIPISRQTLITTNDALRHNSGDPALNAFLLDYRSRSGLQGEVLTTYSPFATIDGLRESLYFDPSSATPSAAVTDALRNAAPICQLIGVLPDHRDLRYLLLHKEVYPEMIDKGIADGSLRLLHETQAIRFLEISCPL